MSDQRTLFLDYDGVLHPDEAYLVKGRPVLRCDGELFMWAGHLSALLDGHPDVRIVLSTSWARELRYARARRYLPEPLRERVIGATWHSGMRLSDDLRPLDRMTWWDLASRYAQIKRYASRAGLRTWLAIDDQPEGWAQSDLSHLIKTDSDKGLSDPAVRQLIAAWLESTAKSRGRSEAMDAIARHAATSPRFSFENAARAVAKAVARADKNS